MSSNQINIHDERINPVDRVFGYNKFRKAILHFNFRKVGSFDELTELERFYNVKFAVSKQLFFKEIINHYLYNQLFAFMKLQKEANKFNAFKKTLKRGELVPTCGIGHKRILLQQCGFRVTSGGRSLKTRVRDIALLKSMPRHNETRSKEITRCHKMLERSFKHMYVETRQFANPELDDTDYIISFGDIRGHGGLYSQCRCSPCIRALIVHSRWVSGPRNERCTCSHCY